MSRKKGQPKSHSADGVICRARKRTGARKDKRMRVQHRFWCDLTKDHIEVIDERLWELKKKRKYQPTIINALRLFFDLQDGKTDVLRELFPGIVEVIAGDSASAQFNQIMMQSMQALHEKLDDKKGLDFKIQPPKPTRDIDEPPTLNDFDDQPTQVASTVDIAENFMNSMMGMLG